MLITSFTPTKEQQAIIEHTEGPLLVIAGPGSGKTFTLVERIAYLIVNKGVLPEHILVATFTEKAATELITRISHRLLSNNIVANVEDMYVGTLHSICLRFLEENREFTRLKKNFTLMDQFDQTYFFFQYLREFEKVAPILFLTGTEKISRWKKANTLCAWLNKLSEELVSPDALKADDNETLQALGQWYLLYHQLLEQENKLDFSVIQLEALRLLENNSEMVLTPLRKQLRYLMVDEYQDTNTIQERLLFTLLNNDQNICVVGDDDQGLYRFRGATIRNILEFPQKFRKCTVHSLTTNYRSAPGIIDFYNSWMDGNKDGFDWTALETGPSSFRYPKTIKASKGKEGFSHPVFTVSSEAPNWPEEVLAFLYYLKEHHLEDWNQVTFLFRSVKNPKTKALAQYLEENGIPIYAPRSDLYFEREEVRLLIGALHFLFPIFKEIRTEWASQYSPLAIWDFYDDCLRLFANYIRQPEHKELKYWCVHRANEIQGMLITNRPLDYGWATLFYQLLQFSLFSRLLELKRDNRDERSARNLAILSQLLVKFEYLHHIQVLHPDFLKKNVSDFFNHFLRYLWDGGLTEFEEAEDTTPQGTVAFMTIHQAKGLEFPVTVVGSLQATPRKQHTDLEKYIQDNYYNRPPFEPLERVKEFDFKRLYYTAFSRAKNLLILSCQEEKTTRGNFKTPTKHFHSFYNQLLSWREVDFSKLSLTKVRPSSFKGRYSFTSHVLVYENCPRQYQFFKYWEFMPVRQGAMLFGQLVHQTIEDVHKSVLRGQPEKINDHLRLWFDVNYANLSQRERVYLAPQIREVAFTHVRRYVERKAGHWADICGTEVDVSLVKDDYILSGKIDLIQGDDNTVEIVDFKATPKPDQYAERYLLDRYKRQLEIYAHLVEERYNLEVRAMNLYYTGEEDGVPTYRFPFERKAVDETITGVDSVVGRMLNKDFAVKERKAKQCKDCDLQAYCDRI